MNTMNIPGFTAEDSVYNTRGHYQTRRQAINSSTHMAGTIQVAAIDVPGETIVIVDTWPPDPWMPPSFGGHTGPGMPVPTGPGSGSGGGGGGSGTQPPRRTRPPARRGFQPSEGGKCHAWGEDLSGKSFNLYVGSYKLKGDEWHCCSALGNCANCNDRKKNCADGHDQP